MGIAVSTPYRDDKNKSKPVRPSSVVLIVSTPYRDNKNMIMERKLK